MVLIAAQTIPRGGTISVDPIGEGETMSFKVKANGANPRLPQTVPALLKGEPGDHAVDAHAIQPFYTGLLARNCGLTADIATEGEAIVVSAQ
jgi:histidine phosphotransferase ChpT